jgi:hypothetical protein
MLLMQRIVSYHVYVVVSPHCMTHVCSVVMQCDVWLNLKPIYFPYTTHDQTTEKNHVPHIVHHNPSVTFFQFLQVNMIQLFGHNNQSKATSSFIPRSTRKFERKWRFGLKFEFEPKSHRTRQRPRTRHGNPVPVAIYLCDMALHCTALRRMPLYRTNQPTATNPTPTSQSIHQSISPLDASSLPFPSLPFPSLPEPAAASHKDDCSCSCSCS